MGEYKNVILSKKEIEDLKEEYPETWMQWVEKLSAYMASTGKTYQKHIATIRLWAMKDGTVEKTRKRRLDEDEIAALEAMLHEESG